MEPLASLLRPTTLDRYVGQSHLVGEGKPIRRFIETGRVPSMIFWGPPGTGKTSLARVIAGSVSAQFYHLSGVTSKKEELVTIVRKARKDLESGVRTIVFLDEIHRWNRAQQDALLPFVEKGIVTLVGATTENPSFTVNNALLSRARTFVFRPISTGDVREFFVRNRAEIESAFEGQAIGDDVIDAVAAEANGDLRFAINLLESALSQKTEGPVTVDDVRESFQQILRYDRAGDEHYDLISAVHKCLRDGDPDAGCYWVGRMLAGGEDPLYVVRRLMRFASEDVGLADPQALILANAVQDTIERIGMPECRLALYQLAAYLARAPKDNSVYLAEKKIEADIREYGNLSVPLVIRNAPTKLMDSLGYGAGYRYAHAERGEGGVPKIDQQHFPDELADRKYFE